MPAVLRHLILLLTTMAVLAVAGCAQGGWSPRAAAGQQRPGYVVPIGGALRFDNAEVWSRLVALAGGPGSRFVVFATASINPDRTAALIIDALQRHGAVAEHIGVAPQLQNLDLAEAVKDPELIEKVRSARGVFFSGGAQSRITDALQPQGQPTPMLQAIWQVYRKGGVIAGTSAGAAVMSTTMFRDPPNVLQVMKHGLREGREIDRGLGFVGPELFVDQHFLRRGRIGRMLPLMLHKGYRLGIGVEENSAAIVHDGEIEVIGGKGVLLADLTDASVDAQQPAFNLRNARLTYLDRGDRYNLRTRVTLPSQQKLRDLKVDPSSTDFSPSFSEHAFYPDILGDTTIVNAMVNLIDNQHGEALGLAFSNMPRPGDSRPDLGFEFRLRRASDSLGWYTTSLGGEDYTVTNIRLDITPVVVSGPLYKPLGTPLSAPTSTPPATGAAPVTAPLAAEVQRQ